MFIFFVNPDIARTFVAIAWWQVTMPLMTAIIGCVVQARCASDSRATAYRYILVPDIPLNATHAITGVQHRRGTHPSEDYVATAWWNFIYAPWSLIRLYIGPTKTSYVERDFVHNLHAVPFDEDLDREKHRFN
ncbi:hypothetical protein C8R44DRAFT_858239 [Mycena epipterygia]|nr:hypothetical protein C8R44DRAFT_858239 [Mycena epipterygia]